jgi:hypothetical protein
MIPGTGDHADNFFGFERLGQHVVPAEVNHLVPQAPIRPARRHNETGQRTVRHSLQGRPHVLPAAILKIAFGYYHRNPRPPQHYQRVLDIAGPEQAKIGFPEDTEQNGMIVLEGADQQQRDLRAVSPSGMRVLRHPDSRFEIGTAAAAFPWDNALQVSPPLSGFS